MNRSVAIACLVFSERGKLLAERLGAQVESRNEAGRDQIAFTFSCAYGPEKVWFREWTEQAFSTAQVLLFIGATGIAVRAIAPLVESKTTDPAVLVMDEAGQWVIPLLSGHIGGANRWAQEVAAICSATPVITTATDVQGVWAVDDWATRHGMLVRNPQNIKVVSSALLRGEALALYSDVPLVGTLPPLLSLTDDRQAAAIVISPFEQRTLSEGVVHLVPVCVNAGIGCRKGTPAKDIEQALRTGLEAAGVVPEAVAAVHSIDIKKDEPGLLHVCESRRLPFITHSAEELERVENSVASSAFVRKTVGVDNVCERSALIGAVRLISERQVYGGVTLALALQDISYDIEDAQ